MALRRRDGGRRQAASPAQRRCADQHPAVPRRRARRRPSKLCISGARQPVRTRHPHPGRPLSFRRATTVGIGPVQKQWTVQLSAGPPRPTRRFSGAGSCEAASHAPIHQDPRLPHQPGVRVGCAHGPCRSLAAPARCPMRRTAQAQPVDAAPGPTATRADRAGAQGPGRPPPAPAVSALPPWRYHTSRARIRRLFLVSQPIPELLTIVHAVD